VAAQRRDFGLRKVTSGAQDAQGIANNTVAMIVAHHLLALAAAVRLRGLEDLSKPVDGPPIAGCGPTMEPARRIGSRS
jgi:hypothetical protein